MLVVTIPGPPVAQGRPKACIRGGHASVYEPAKSRSWKGAAQFHMRDAIAKASPNCWSPLTCPLHIEILAVWPQPKSTPKKQRDERRYRPSRPDADNVAKAVLDAGNGILWHDDSQVARLVVSKLVGAVGEAPHVQVTVMRLPA